MSNSELPERASLEYLKRLANANDVAQFFEACTNGDVERVRRFLAAVGNLDLIRTVVEQTPALLDRCLSPFERGMTPLHFAMRRRWMKLRSIVLQSHI